MTHFTKEIKVNESIILGPLDKWTGNWNIGTNNLRDHTLNPDIGIW